MRTILLAFVIFVASCSEKQNTLTPEMESQARKTIEAYLEKNQLPLEGLERFSSSASPNPDFGFLYTGGGRCIEFAVTCHSGNCTDWAKYPYDDHGEKCP
ncbi:MAG: hypothetical protein K6L80_15565 [Agarilytica sp.]